MKCKRLSPFFLMLILMSVMLIMVSCSNSNDDSDEVPPDSGAEAVPSPSLDVGLRPNNAHIGYEGIGFGYASGLIDNFEGSKMAAYTNFAPFYNAAAGTIFENVPDFIEIVLRVQGAEGRIGVQPTHNAEGQFFNSYQAADLQRIGVIENDVSSQAGAVEIDPRPPKLSYLPFANGNGRRYLTFDPTDDTQRNLYYLFEGVTSTGHHLVWFTYPVTSSYLDGIAADTPVETILQQLDDLSLDLFTPNLTQLDQLVESFQIEPMETFDYLFSTEATMPGKLVITYSGQPSLALLDVYVVEGATGNGQAVSSTPTINQLELELSPGNYRLFAHDPSSNLLGFYGHWDANQAALQTVSVPSGQTVTAQISLPNNPCSQIVPASPDGKYEATDSPAVQRRIGCTPAGAANARTYIVREGDTIYGIATQHGVGWERLAEVNGIFWPFTIQMGQELVLPRN